jgi:hypothetical protein
MFLSAKDDLSMVQPLPTPKEELDDFSKSAATSTSPRVQATKAMA